MTGRCPNVNLALLNGLDVPILVPRLGHTSENPGSALEGEKSFDLTSSVYLDPGQDDAVTVNLTTRCTEDTILRMEYTRLEPDGSNDRTARFDVDISQGSSVELEFPG